MRKDALAGLKELLAAHDELVAPNLGTILRPCARLISDDDGSVRRALVAFLSWLLPRQDTAALEPFTPLLLFFTTAGLSHIFVEVRIESLKVLDLLLDKCPDEVTSGWLGGTADSHGSRAIECYYALLHAKGGAATVQSSPAVRASEAVAHSTGSSRHTALTLALPDSGSSALA